MRMVSRPMPGCSRYELGLFPTVVGKGLAGITGLTSLCNQRPLNSHFTGQPILPQPYGLLCSPTHMSQWRGITAHDWSVEVASRQQTSQPSHGLIAHDRPFPSLPMKRGRRWQAYLTIGSLSPEAMRARTKRRPVDREQSSRRCDAKPACRPKCLTSHTHHSTRPPQNATENRRFDRRSQ